MNTFTLQEVFSFGYKKTIENIQFLVNASACVLVLTFVIDSLQEMASKSSTALGAIFFALTFAFDIIIKIGYTKIYLKLIDNEEVGIEDVFNHHGYFFTYCVAYVLLSVLTITGLLAGIIPGIIIILFFFFVPYLVIDKDYQVVDAFKKSYEMTKGNRFKLLGFILAAGVLNLIGLCLFIVGLLVTIPMTYFAATYIYRKLYK